MENCTLRNVKKAIKTKENVVSLHQSVGITLWCVHCSSPQPWWATAGQEEAKRKVADLGTCFRKIKHTGTHQLREETVTEGVSQGCKHFRGL